MFLGCKKTAPTDTKNSTKKTNIVLINVDDLGWKDLGLMGSKYYETPNLDKFDNEGMVFTNTYASVANCVLNSRILTSI